MTVLQKISITLALSGAIGAGGYEGYQTFRLREQAQAIRQQQAPLFEQIHRLQQERDETMNRLASLLSENQQWKSNSQVVEIQRLRAEVRRLQATQSETESDPDESAVDSWLNRVNRLKEYVRQHPDQGIPEFKFLTAREWLLIAAPEGPVSDRDAVMQDLKVQAEPRFAEVVQQVLQRYAQANGGQFPSDLAQLQPYCDADIEDILQQRYEIKPASILPASSVKDQRIKTDWVIAGKDPVASNTADHIAIYTNGYTYFW